MSCERFEKWIALYIEGDLAERKARRVEAHLAGCAACRERAESLAQSQQALKSLRAEAVDARTLEQVRRGVLDQIAAGQRAPQSWLWLAWRYVLAGVLVAIAGATLWWRSHRAEPVRPVVARAPVAAQSPDLGAPAPPTVAATRPQKHPRLAHRSNPATPRQPAEESEPLLVKLQTDDPNVVIFLLVDQNGG